MYRLFGSLNDSSATTKIGKNRYSSTAAAEIGTIRARTQSTARIYTNSSVPARRMYSATRMTMLAISVNESAAAVG